MLDNHRRIAILLTDSARRSGKVLLSLVSVGLILAFTDVSAQEQFSCSIGRPACLSYDEKIVDQNDICFSSMTCGYEGFVCKSKFDDLFRNYDDLARKHKELADEAEALVSKNNQLVDDYNELLAKYKNLTSDFDDTTEELRALTVKYDEKIEELRAMRVKYNKLLAVQRAARDQKVTSDESK